MDSYEDGEHQQFMLAGMKIPGLETQSTPSDGIEKEASGAKAVGSSN